MMISTSSCFFFFFNIGGLHVYFISSVYHNPNREAGTFATVWKSMVCRFSTSQQFYSLQPRGSSGSSLVFTKSHPTDLRGSISNSLIRLEISSNRCSMCFSSIKDLYESFMEHTFLEFRRILRIIIHNICHLLQRALEHPFNVYLMFPIQYNIK